MKKLFKLLLNIVPRPILIRLSYLIRPLLALLLKGSQFTDPIDGSSYRKFLSYGYQNLRENALCPGTLSLERHRLLWLYLTRKTNFLNQPLKVLHIAPEQVFYTKFKAIKDWEYTTTDLHSPLADIKADICALPFNNDQYDLIFCNHVLEHVQDDTRAMKELFRVMKKGGMGIFQVPQDLNRNVTFEDNSITDPKERAKIFGQYDHVRVYGKDYFDKLRSIGFKVEEVNYSQKISSELSSRYRLMEGELLPVVFKN